MSNPNSPAGGPPLRALAMVLIALAIVFAGLGAMSLSSSDSSDAGAASSSGASSTSAAPATTAPQQNSAQATTAPVAPSSAAATTTVAPTTTAPPTTTAAPTTTPEAAGVDKSLPVRVLNNGVVPGLAAKTGGQLTGEGFNVTEVGNYPGGVISKTTVYYGSSPKEQALAQAIASELGCSAEPRFPGISDSPAGVIVIVTGN